MDEIVKYGELSQSTLCLHEFAVEFLSYFQSPWVTILN